MTPPATLEDYLDALTSERRAIALEIIDLIRALVPDAAPSLRYGMPAFRFPNGVILHFGFWKRHLGIYPVYRGAPAFEAAIGLYRSGKDGARLALAKPVPMDIVRMIALDMSQRPDG